MMCWQTTVMRSSIASSPSAGICRRGNPYLQDASPISKPSTNPDSAAVSRIGWTDKTHAAIEYAQRFRGD
jgi:hypothetical protein